MKISLSSYQTPFKNQLMIGTMNEKIVWIDWFEKEEEQIKAIKKYFKTDIILFEKTLITNQITNEFDLYFQGSLKEFKSPIQLIGTDFQKKVWNTLLTIPYGATSTYSDQAIKVGDIKAIRAVASANGANPISIIIPCHRIIGKDGSLTGYRGGINTKKMLLDHEATFSNKPVQGSLFL